ncbi:cyclic nucleotide-binding domain-containing protein [Magnetococcales bacterium HHB-1]
MFRLFKPQGFSSWSKDRLLGTVYLPGALIFRQGEVSDYAFAVQKGKVILFRQEPKGEEIVLAKIKTGDIFGITPLVGSDIRLVSARAVTKTRVLRLDKRQLMQQMVQDPSLALKILAKAFKRMERLAVQTPKNQALSIHPQLDDRSENQQLLTAIYSKDVPDTLSKPSAERQTFLESQIHYLMREGLKRGLFGRQEILRLAETQKQTVLNHFSAQQEINISEQDRLHLLINDLPPTYFLSFDTTGITQHLSLLLKKSSPVIAFLPHTTTNRYALLSYAPDHPAILAHLSGGLTAFNLSIERADHFITQRGFSLDYVVFQGKRDIAGQDLIQLATLFSKIRSLLEDFLAEKFSPEEKMPATFSSPHGTDKAKKEPPEILFSNEQSKTFTVIQIKSRDQLGLLFRLSRALQRANLVIYSAKIVTADGWATDQFYVKNMFGEQLAERQIERTRAILESFLL